MIGRATSLPNRLGGAANSEMIQRAPGARAGRMRSAGSALVTPRVSPAKAAVAAMIVCGNFA